MLFSSIICCLGFVCLYILLIDYNKLFSAQFGQVSDVKRLDYQEDVSDISGCVCVLHQLLGHVQYPRFNVPQIQIWLQEVHCRLLPTSPLQVECPLGSCNFELADTLSVYGRT